MAEKINFTKTNLEVVACPEGKDRVYVYDLKTPGLAMLVTAAGAKSYYLYKKINGRPERVLLGKYSDITPEQARTAAQKTAGQFALGVNPQEQKRAVRGEITVGELFKDWLARHAKQHKKSWKRDEKNFDLHLADWKNRKLSQIRRNDVTTTHTKLGADVGPYLANRMLSLLSALFNWAITNHDFAKGNPAKGVKKFKEASRERFLQADELPAFAAAMKSEPSADMRDFFWLCLLTGARRANIQAMKWEEINTQRAEWLIPDTKGGMAVTVALSDPAMKIVKDRMGNGSAYVFASHGKSGHMTEPKKAWAALLTRAGLKDLRIHDLRRTLGSWQAAGGASLPIIGKSLGHKNQATTAIYARLNLDPVRASVEGATEAMLAASRVKVKKVQAIVTDAPKALPAPTKAKRRKKSPETALPTTEEPLAEPSGV